jgi:hypothetical protein
MNNQKTPTAKRVGGSLPRLVRWWRDRYVCLSIPFRGWRYYVDFMWCHHYQGREPWVVEVHPKCADIKGWRFGWRRISICWGREKLYSPNDKLTR